MRTPGLFCAMSSTVESHVTCISDLLCIHIILTILKRIKEEAFLFPLYKNTLSKQNSLRYMVMIACFYLISCETSHILIYENLFYIQISEVRIFLKMKFTYLENLLVYSIGIYLIIWTK